MKGTESTHGKDWERLAKRRWRAAKQCTAPARSDRCSSSLVLKAQQQRDIEGVEKATFSMIKGNAALHRT